MSWMKGKRASEGHAGGAQKVRRSISASSNPFATASSKTITYPTRASEFLHGFSPTNECEDVVDKSDIKTLTCEPAISNIGSMRLAPETSGAATSVPESTSASTDSGLLGMLSDSASSSFRRDRVSKRRRRDEKKHALSDRKQQESTGLSDLNFDFENHFQDSDFAPNSPQKREHLIHDL